jgi:uncharacterized protein (DUF1778 family)
LRVTLAQKEAIQAAANAAEMTVSDWVIEHLTKALAQAAKRAR